MSSDPLRRRNNEISFPIPKDWELRKFREALTETLLQPGEKITSFKIEFGDDTTADVMWRQRDKTNIFPAAQRIGHEQKQQYRDLLIEAHVTGFLTQEEFDARMDRLTAALTRQQADQILKDLKDVRLTQPPVMEQQSRRSLKTEPIITATAVFAVLGLVAGLTGDWGSIAALAALWAVFTLRVIGWTR